MIPQHALSYYHQQQQQQQHSPISRPMDVTTATHNPPLSQFTSMGTGAGPPMGALGPAGGSLQAPSPLYGIGGLTRQTLSQLTPLSPSSTLTNRQQNFQSQQRASPAQSPRHAAPASDIAAVVPVDLIQDRRPFKCEFDNCGKSFKNLQTLRMHHKTHAGDERSRTHNGELRTDPVVSGERVMKARLGDSSSLKAGRNKKIPSACPTCHKTFVGLYELRRHFGRKHSQGEKNHVCSKCGKRFYVDVDLRDHEKLCGALIQCSCGMKFAFKCNLVAHKKASPKCNEFNPGVSPATSALPSGIQSSNQNGMSLSLRPPPFSNPNPASAFMPTMPAGVADNAMQVSLQNLIASGALGNMDTSSSLPMMASVLAATENGNNGILGGGMGGADFSILQFQQQQQQLGNLPDATTLLLEKLTAPSYDTSSLGLSTVNPKAAQLVLNTPGLANTPLAQMAALSAAAAAGNGQLMRSDTFAPLSNTTPPQALARDLQYAAQAASAAQVNLQMATTDAIQSGYSRASIESVTLAEVQAAVSNAALAEAAVQVALSNGGINDVQAAVNNAAMAEHALQVAVASATSKPLSGPVSGQIDSLVSALNASSMGLSGSAFASLPQRSFLDSLNVANTSNMGNPVNGNFSLDGSQPLSAPLAIAEAALSSAGNSVDDITGSASFA
eukprot:jgi/Chlat1/4408/Chrsp29S04621